MKNVIQLEELGMLIFSFFLFLEADISWWWFFVLLLTPDISMLGYISGPKTGAMIYNIFHHKGLGILLLLVGYFFHHPIAYISGVIIFGHASMDRLFGYGLKYERGFKFTHLGEIGK